MTEQSQNRPKAKIVIDDFSVLYDGQAALRGVSLEIVANERLAIIGPARSGKTTLLRSLNRLNDLDERAEHSGKILLDGQDIYDPKLDVTDLRRRLGMVYATPTPLPWSIYDNIVYGLRLAGVRSREKLDAAVESSLTSAYIWDELKDRLEEPATNLSGGQQQCVCLARVLALEPEVLLLDEPCSGLDPISTARIEEALYELKSRYTIVLVTNNTKQAARASDRTAFFLMGELIEIGPTTKIFTAPDHSRTNDYLTGNFG
ncbi:MAG: phosphate ABC transporter ATP-binding protein [Planctomycetaceae bacterium]|nr:phosphate ABC transporter ATP-binding protein [Planctomycetaceae bacterium]